MHTAARRISIMGICNKVAGILSPIVLSLLVFKGISHLDKTVMAASSEHQREAILNAFAAKVYLPYMIMAVVLVLLSVMVLKSSLPEVRSSEVNAEPVGGEHYSEKKSIFQFPHLLLGALCIFVYVGVEVMAGDAIGTYAQGFHIPAEKTTFYTSFTLGAMLLGYVTGLFTIPRIMTQEQSLKISACLGIVFTFLAFLTRGYVSVTFVALLGLANALMWPAIFPLAITGLGKFTEKGSALLIMGIAGGAVIPKLFALLKEHYHFQWVFMCLMIPCYIFILFYAVKGHNVRSGNGVSGS